MERHDETIKVGMERSLKEMVLCRCEDLNISYSEYIRMLIILDINSYTLKSLQYNEMNLSESIDNIKTKLENF